MADKKKKQKINWPQVVAAALLTLIVTVTGGITLVVLTSQKPNLQYEVFPKVEFRGDSLQFVIHNITIKNSGGAPAEDFTGVITFFTPFTEVQESHSESMEYESVLDSTNMQHRISTRFFNQGQSITFTFLSPYIDSETPEVSCQARGVICEPEIVLESGAISNLPQLIIVLAALGLMGGIFMLLTSTLQYRLEQQSQVEKEKIKQQMEALNRQWDDLQRKGGRRFDSDV